MIKTFAVNTKNDLYIDKTGKLAISTDLQAVLEACAHVVKVSLGEMILNTDQGIPFFQAVWNGVPNIQQFNAAIRQAILSIDGVIEITSLLTSKEGDRLKYTAVIRTIYGGGAIRG